MSEKKRITILIDEDTKEKWDQYANEKKISTISELIRDSVNFCIDHDALITQFKDFSKFSHDLKEPLTSIKGFSQIIIKNFADKLDPGIMQKIKKIYTQTEFLENIINTILNEPGDEKSQTSYDILIIEDDSATIDVLEEFFDLRGYKAKGVNSGMKGLDELNIVKPKLILLDILLPDIDGYDVCKKIKSDSKLKDVPVFYTTAVPIVEVNKKVKETGANGVLSKPFNLDDFEILFNYL